MIIYLLSKNDLSIKDAKTISSYELKMDIDFSDTSKIVLADSVDLEDGDFALLKDGIEQHFFGICKTMTPSDKGFQITMKQPEAMFDTTVYNDNEDLILESGIEDFVVDVINRNFVASGDALMDMDYISVSASTHTPIHVKVSTIVDAENGVFNLKTFLGNIRQNYGIFLDFSIENNMLLIDVNCREQDVLNIDTKLPEVADLSEKYDVTVLARLVVKWDIPKQYVTTDELAELTGG